MQHLERFVCINLKCVMALSDNKLVPCNTYCFLEWYLVELDVERAECHANDP